MSPPSDGASDNRGGLLLRLGGFAALLVAEYGVLAVRFDGLMHGQSGWWSQLTGVITLASLTALAAIVLFAAPLRAQLGAILEGAQLPTLPMPLAIHALGHLGTWATALTLEGAQLDATQFGAGVAVFCLSGLLSVAGLALGVLRLHDLRTLVGRVQRIGWAALAVGGVTFVAGWSTTYLWPLLSRTTLTAVVAVTRLLSDDVEVEPEHLILSVEGFTVLVARECSGLEGIGLMTTLTGLYLYFGRARLRFPAALLLVPIGALAIAAANIVRIAALVLVGARVSPDIALSGFHSKAGWMFFCAVALGLLAITPRMRWITKPERLSDPRVEAGEATIAPYLMPLLAVLATTLATGLWAVDIDYFYGLRVLVGAVALFVYRKPLLALPRRVSFYAPLSGVLVMLLWLQLVPPADPELVQYRGLALSAMDPMQRALWLTLRILGACVTAPIIEELAFRGYLLRRMIDEDFTKVPLTRLTVPALLFSSLAFGALHDTYVAGAVAGALYALTMRARGSLADAIVAHGVTNLLLAIYVLQTGQWGYW